MSKFESGLRFSLFVLRYLVGVLSRENALSRRGLDWLQHGVKRFITVVETERRSHIQLTDIDVRCHGPTQHRLRIVQVLTIPLKLIIFGNITAWCPEPFGSVRIACPKCRSTLPGLPPRLVRPTTMNLF